MAEERMKGEEQVKLISRADTPQSGESIVVNSKSDDSNQFNQTSSTAKNKNTTAEAGNNNGDGSKAKSCKGCLYYSSRFKSDSRNPLCVGLTRSLPNVPQYMVGQSEVEASKEGRNLTEFRYGCIGYSLYEDRKGQDSSGQQSQTQLPVCFGLEVLVDRRVNTADSASAPAHIHNKGDGNGLPQRRPPKPTNSTGEEFFSRFTRNANLVAKGVAKNTRRVGNQLKQCLDDIMYRRPK